jgi:hypothetical protein
MKQWSVLLPLAMSLAALALVLGHVAVSGGVRETDEGTAAHLWQLLMAAQVPVAFFAITWLPRAPRQALLVIGIAGCRRARKSWLRPLFQPLASRAARLVVLRGPSSQYVRCGFCGFTQHFVRPAVVQRNGWTTDGQQPSPVVGRWAQANIDALRVRRRHARSAVCRGNAHRGRTGGTLEVGCDLIAAASARRRCPGRPPGRSSSPATL